MFRLRFMLALLSSAVFVWGTPQFVPLPQTVDYDREKALLGKKLYHDTRLSKDNTISCASCHILNMGGVDRSPTSVGIKGQIGPINAPTVYNARFNFVQFWDGRAKDLQDQAGGPVENPIEMGAKFEEVIPVIAKDPMYAQLFDRLYDGEISKATITHAIAEFEKALVTPNSRFDRFLRGETSALTGVEKKGFELFVSKGCASCHNGVNLGGNLYQKAGVFDKFPDVDGQSFQGRYAVTKDERDRYFVKVPTLRNISRTAPYFHHGKTADLLTAIQQMAYYQLGLALSMEDARRIEAFLLTLDGEVPEIAK